MSINPVYGVYQTPRHNPRKGIYDELAHKIMGLVGMPEDAVVLLNDIFEVEFGRVLAAIYSNTKIMEEMRAYIKRHGFRISISHLPSEKPSRTTMQISLISLRKLGPM